MKTDNYGKTGTYSKGGKAKSYGNREGGYKNSYESRDNGYKKGGYKKDYGSNRSTVKRIAGPEQFGKSYAAPEAPQPAVKRYGNHHKDFEPATKTNNPLRNAYEPAVEEDELFENTLEGRNPVKEAIKSGRAIDRILYADGDGAARQIAAQAGANGVLIQQVERKHLDKISKTGVHQGIIAYVAAKEYCDVQDILDYAADKNEDPFILILDGITDPQNLGSMLRSAECAGVHGVIIPKRRAVGLTPVVAKASAGAIEYMRVAKVSNLAQTVEQLKRAGVWVFGAAMDGESYTKTNLCGPVAIIIGSEGNGIGQNLRAHCDRIIALPLLGNIESLNAAVSAAVIMYEGVRQRSANAKK